jgi:enamine deaminase RidA (YjgF/YER057c/UK114 family)
MDKRRGRLSMPREYVPGTWEANRSFSPAVVTRGGRVAWLAGVGAWKDEQGNVLRGDFAAQVNQTFKEIGETLARLGGKVSDIVTMTVWILDARHGDEFTELRKQWFPDGDYPASALITAAGFAKPEMMVEIQAVAVLGDE